jgi:quinoprotein glucose dehydrogenase
LWETGKPDDGFGTGGWIDLRAGIAERYQDRRYGIPRTGESATGDLPGRWCRIEPRGPSGDARLRRAHREAGLDVPHGARRVRQRHLAARCGRNAAALTLKRLSVDTERGILFLPLTSPATDSYGGDRHGANLFSDSLVALNAATGKRLWHFQTVHHNLWDYDLPAQPTLVRVTRDGKPVDAVAQVTKIGFTFVFDVAAKPLFPSSARSQSGAPGKLPIRPSRARNRRMRTPAHGVRKLPAAPDPAPTGSPWKRLLGDLFAQQFQPTVLFPGTSSGANWVAHR